MAKIDFVPDDYIERKESHRTNYFYLAMVILLAVGLSGAFGVIKVRQKGLAKEAEVVNEKMAGLQQKAAQLEQIQIRRKEMMETAVLSANLIEPIPRSVIIAFLVNTLPDGVSLSGVKIQQKEDISAPAAASKYDAAKAVADGKPTGGDYLTSLVIEGLAVSDIGVADYIASLKDSKLLTNVSLVYSKQKNSKTVSYRQFRLTARLAGQLVLTNSDIEQIRNYAKSD